MRIAFLTPHIKVSGGVKLILGYADRLAKRGHKVTVICPQPSPKIKRIPVLYLIVYPIVYPKRVAMNFLKYKPDWIEVAADIKYPPSCDEKYIPDGDIIVATAWETAYYVEKCSLKKGRKFYLFMHYERLWDDGCKDVDKGTYRLPLKKIVISSCLQEVLKKNFGQDSTLVETPIDHHIFYPVRNGYNKNKRICMHHHIFGWKGVNDGIKAFEIAKKAYPEIQLLMFGSRKKTVSINCEYHYRPTSEEVRTIYNSCDIFLCPSWREGFGLPSAEAMACKCGLVTTDTGGCRDYAIHEKTALVSPPKDPEALARNLCRFLGDEELLKTIAENGYEHIKQFTWEKAVDKMEKLFLEELKSRSV